jgi:hypothetical protein
MATCVEDPVGGVALDTAPLIAGVSLKGDQIISDIGRYGSAPVVNNIPYGRRLIKLSDRGILGFRMSSTIKDGVALSSGAILELYATNSNWSSVAQTNALELYEDIDTVSIQSTVDDILTLLGTVNTNVSTTLTNLAVVDTVVDTILTGNVTIRS